MSSNQTRRSFLVSSLALASGLRPALASPPTVSGMPEPTGYRITRWAQDPFSRGSYSFRAKGARPRDRAALADPVNATLFFAGEACASDHPATVHGALMSGQRAAKAMLAVEAQTVAIIGAGIAGLVAAQILSQAGRHVAVTEARERIGGRLWSERSLGLPLDLGASWIHGIRGNPLTKIADQLRLRRSETDWDSIAVYGERGQEIPYEAVPEWFDTRWEYDLEYGAAPTELARRADEEGGFFPGPHVIFPSGYDQILTAFSGNYDMRLSNPVRSVSYQPGMVQIDAPQPIKADACLITVPLGVLKQDAISFEPPLPHAKQQAINALGMGLLDKTYLMFPKVFWPAQTQFLGAASASPHPFAHWVNFTPHIGAPVLCGFNGAATARRLDDLHDTQLVEMALHNLVQLHR